MRRVSAIRCRFRRPPEFGVGYLNEGNSYVLVLIRWEAFRRMRVYDWSANVSGAGVPLTTGATPGGRFARIGRSGAAISCRARSIASSWSVRQSSLHSPESMPVDRSSRRFRVRSTSRIGFHTDRTAAVRSGVHCLAVATRGRGRGSSRLLRDRSTAVPSDRSSRRLGSDRCERRLRPVQRS